MRWILLLTTLLQLAACTNPPWPRGSLEELYPDAAARPLLRTLELRGRSLFSAQTPGNGITPILFVHGSPGGWKSWARFLDAPALAGFGPRIAVDRPGFGGSSAGDVMLDLRQQADLLADVIPPGAPAILVGHSLGGPLIAWMAIDHPEKVCGGVMVAGSMAPELEAPRWYNRLADNWLARRMLPSDMERSNREMMALQTELRRLEAELPRLRRPLVALQGSEDPLVDPRTADYLEQRAPAQWMRVLRAPGKDHFIQWRDPESVLQQILSLPCEAR